MLETEWPLLTERSFGALIPNSCSAATFNTFELADTDPRADSIQRAALWNFRWFRNIGQCIDEANLLLAM